MEHMVPMEGHIYDMFPRKILGSKLYSVQTAIRTEVKNSKNAVSLSLRAILWVLSQHGENFPPWWFAINFYGFTMFFSNMSKPENGRTKQNRSGSSHLNYRARTIAILGCGGINEFHHLCCWHNNYYMDLLVEFTLFDDKFLPIGKLSFFNSIND